MARKDSMNGGLLRRWFARPVSGQPDAADYGTAFGMELSFEPVAADDVALAGAGAHDPSWVQTLTSSVRHRLGRLRTAV
jgi:hypothetical protein